MTALILSRIGSPLPRARAFLREATRGLGDIMKSFITIGLVAALAGCGGETPSPTGTGGVSSSVTVGVGGAGGSAASTSATGTGGASASSSSGTGGDIELGTIDCPGASTPIAPIMGDITDPSGVVVDETGGGPAVDWTPPSYPFTVTGWRYRIYAGGQYCQKVSHSVAAFVGPDNDVAPAMPADAQVIKVAGSKIGVDKIVTIALPVPVTLVFGQKLWRLMKTAGGGPARSCIPGCELDAPSLTSWYSAPEPDGKPLDCPTVGCRFNLRKDSPWPDAAEQFGNTNRGWAWTVIGHAG